MASRKVWTPVSEAIPRAGGYRPSGTPALGNSQNNERRFRFIEGRGEEDRIAGSHPENFLDPKPRRPTPVVLTPVSEAIPRAGGYRPSGAPAPGSMARGIGPTLVFGVIYTG